MQIFFIDYDPKKIAQQQCDKHCVKMPTEIMQIISTVWQISSPIQAADYFARGWLYKPVRNYTHPAIRWVGQSLENYVWAVHFLAEMCLEFEFRYKHHHFCINFLPFLCEKMTLPHLPNIPFVKMSEDFQAIPEEYKREDPVVAYRMFYIVEKSRFAVWRKAGREAPEWYTEGLNYYLAEKLKLMEVK